MYAMISFKKTSQSSTAKDVEVPRAIESTTNVAKRVPSPVPDHSPGDSKASQMSCGENNMVDIWWQWKREVVFRWSFPKPKCGR